jgi:hypothetical protein
MLSSNTTSAAPLTVTVTNLRFTANIYTPTAAPNAGPAPPPPTNVITDTLLLSLYADSKCTSPAVGYEEEGISLGLCNWDDSTKAYTVYSHASYSVVNPLAPVEVSFQIASFTDAACTKPKGNPSTFPFTIRNCTSADNPTYATNTTSTRLFMKADLIGQDPGNPGAIHPPRLQSPEGIIA